MKGEEFRPGESCTEEKVVFHHVLSYRINCKNVNSVTSQKQDNKEQNERKRVLKI